MLLDFKQELSRVLLLLCSYLVLSGWFPPLLARSKREGLLEYGASGKPLRP